jgi:uncharacterized membrane protein YjjP (DUF1212 family)
VVGVEVSHMSRVPVPTRPEQPPGPRGDAADLIASLADLLLRWSYEGTVGAERVVRRVADRYGVPVDVAFLPDAAILTVDGRTVVRSAAPTVPPLNQVSAVKRLLDAIDRGAVPAEEVARRLTDVRRLPPAFGPAWRVLGLVLFSVGFGVSIQATWQEAVASAVLGLVVGVLVVLAEPRPRLALVAPFVASVLVATAVLLAYRHGVVDGGPIPLMLPALFYFIPGDALAAAAVELAYGRITAGAARLVYSLATLLMLGFGAVVGAVLAGVPQSALFDADPPGNLGPVAVAAGWVVFAVGVMLTFSMAPGDFPWALGLLLGTAAVAALGSAAVGVTVGTFVAAVAMAVAALSLGRRPGRPPPYVLYLGAFYVLTPGSHGLRGIESWVGGRPVDALGSVADMLGLLAAIALGMLVGAAVARPRPGALR